MLKAAKKSILEAIGQTPIVRLNNITSGLEIESEIYVKIEFLNPGGSIKDRIGVFMIEKAEKSGLLKPGGTIVEATSGNTGMGLAIAAAVKGYKAIFVMPDKMSTEKIQNLRAFGAKVVITPTAVAPEDPRSYYQVAAKLARETPNSFYANQYHNPDNPETHYQWTGPEIWEQVGAELSTFVAGMGTGGTISGCAKFLKEKNPKLKVVGVDPIGSLYYEYFRTGKLGASHSYLTEGIGEDFLPSTMNMKCIDEVIQVSDKEALNMTRSLLKSEGICAGPSSGSAVAGALKYARALTKPEKILVIIPDTGSRYLSKVYNDDWMRENGILEEGFATGTLEDLLQHKRTREVITVDISDSVENVIRKMKTYDISQFPVLRGDELEGTLSEAELVQPLFEGRIKGEDAIEKFVRKNVARLSLQDSVGKLAQVLESGHNAVVIKDKKIVGVLTKIDLISFLSERLQRESS